MASLLELDLTGTALTLDSGFDSQSNKIILGRYGIRGEIKPNPRNTRDEQKLRALQENFDETTYKQRYKIERCFAWEDVYRKLVIRYERLQCTHLGFKYIAYSMINLRWFIGKK